MQYNHDTLIGIFREDSNNILNLLNKYKKIPRDILDMIYRIIVNRHIQYCPLSRFGSNKCYYRHIYQESNNEEDFYYCPRCQKLGKYPYF